MPVRRESGSPKIAILIVAHDYPSLLDRLVSRLAPDFEVYLHLDARMDFDVNAYEWGKYVTVVPSRKTFWGSFQVTLAILDLLTVAAEKEHERYILLSGQDTPLVDNEEIGDFFDQHHDKDFIVSIPLSSPKIGGDIHRFTRKYWKAPYRYSGFRSFLYWLIEYSLDIAFRTVLQPRLVVGEFFWGETWFSLKNETVSAILQYDQSHPEFRRLFRGSRLAEEVFIQTLVRRIEPETRVANEINTYVDWESGPETPRILTLEDLQRLRKSGFLFARKIHPEKSRSLLEALESTRD